jgi:outer membrane protein W
MQFSRKILLPFLLLFATQGYSEKLAFESKPIIEAKGGYFFFASSKMRQVYDAGWDIQLSSSIPVSRPFNKLSLNIYGSIEFLRCSGNSTEEHDKTYIWELPINVGVKPIFLLSQQVQSYFSLGPRYFFIRQDNTSPYVDKNKSRNGLGLFVNAGFNFILRKHLVIDLFGEYSYAKTHFHSSTSNIYTRDIQVGGFTFGGSLGYFF